MQELVIQNLTFKYKTSNKYIFLNQNFKFEKGFTCVNGANGCGKTTLLKLISKDIKSDFKMKKCLVYYSEQDSLNKPKYYDEFIYSYDKEALRLKEKLHIESCCFKAYDTMSSGIKKRFQIATALYFNPDILLLDEPTNHLDYFSKEIVIDLLLKYKGIAIIVSHDRAFLDKICTKTIFLLDDFKYFEFKTNFSNALLEFEKLNQHINNKISIENKHVKKINALIQIQKEKISQSNKRVSKKNIDKSDKSQKEKINLAKLTGKNKKDGQNLKKFQSDKNRIFKNKSQIIQKDYSDNIDFDCTKKSKPFSFTLKKSQIKIADIIIHFDDITISHMDKIAIKGINSCGKTTFLKYLISTIKDIKYFYLEQEIPARQIKHLLDYMSSLSSEKQSKFFTIVRKLNSNMSNILTSNNPSQGEIKKLLIAKSIIEKYDFLILDEPTNHMDIKSILSLENALKKYNGTLLIISHDEVFLKNISNKTLFFKKCSAGFNITNYIS